MKEYVIAVIMMSSPPMVTNPNENLVLDSKNQKSVISKYMKPMSSYQKIKLGKRSKNLNSFDQFISNLKQKANLENDFNKLGINIEKDFSKIISGVNILRLSNNPIKLDKEDLKRIILNT